MSLDYASDNLGAAVRALAVSESPPVERLQSVWKDHVQMVWEQPCLTRDLLRDFRDLWHRYTAPSDDRQSTRLRTLGRDEAVQAIDELVNLWAGVVREAACTPSKSAKLATLADLQ